MAVSPAHSHIVTGDANGRLVIWEVFTPVTESSNSSKEVRKRARPQRMCIGHSGTITSIDFGVHKWGMEIVISLSAEGTVAVWTLSDGRCLGKRSFILKSPLACSLAKTIICTFHNHNFAMVAGLDSFLEVIDLSTLESVWSQELDSGGEWVCDIIEHFEERFRPSNAYVLTADGVLHKVALENGNSDGEKSTTVQSWKLHWKTIESRALRSSENYAALSPTSKKQKERNVPKRIAVDSSPRKLCTSKDGSLVCLFGKNCWGVLMASWLTGDGNNLVPVVLVDGPIPTSSENNHGFDLPYWESGSFCEVGVQSNGKCLDGEKKLVAVWTACGLCCLYSIGDLEKERRDGVQLLCVLKEPHKSTHPSSLSVSESLYRISHATQAFPGLATRTGMTHGSMSFVVFRDKEDLQQLQVFKNKGFDNIMCWTVDLNSLGTMGTSEEMVSVEDGFFLPETEGRRCGAALVVHDDGIGGLNGTPATMVRAFEDGTIEFAAMPYDPKPLVVSCTGSENAAGHSSKGVSCLTLACPLWARQRSAQGKLLVTRLLICGCSDGTVRVWTFTSDVDKVYARTPPYVSAKMCFSHHGHRGRIIDVSTALPRQLLTPSAPKEQSFHKDAAFQERLFCTIGEDRGINVYAVTIATREHVGVELLHFLQGHPAPISSIQWRLSAGLVISCCTNGIALVWGLQSGQMERRVSSSSIGIPHDRHSHCESISSVHKTFKTSSLRGEWEGTVDHLMDVLRQGGTQQSIRDSVSAMGVDNASGQSSRHRALSLSPMPGLQTSFGGVPNDSAKASTEDVTGPSMINLKISSDRDSPLTSEHPVQIVKLEGTNRSCSRDGPAPDIILVSISAVAKRAASSGAATNRPVESSSPSSNGLAKWHTDMNLAVVSYLLSWGLDEDIDNSCFTQLGLTKPDCSDLVSYALRGAGGALTLTFPKTTYELKRWNISPEMSALHSLALVSLFMSLMSSQSRQGGLQQGFFSKLITHYGIVFPEKLRPHFIEPSLSMLAHYGLDSWEDGHVSARLLLQGTIERMEERERVAQAAEWAARLHSADERKKKEEEDAKNEKLAAEEAVLETLGADALGLLPGDGAQKTPNNGRAASVTKRGGGKEGASSRAGDNFPGEKSSAQKALSLKIDSVIQTGTKVASSLGFTVGKSKDSAVKKIAVDNERDVMVLILSVIGVTFPQHIAPPTARLVTATLLDHLNFGEEIIAALSAELIGKGFVLWRPHIPNLSGLIRRLLSLALYAEYYGGAVTKNIDGTEKKGVSVAAAAQRAMLEIGAFQPLLFISTVGVEILRTDMTDEYHRTSIMAMVSLVKKRPLALSRHLAVVVEAVIKSLDPSKPLLRKGCLQASTKALHELVKRFPVVAFHQRTQRFAVGTPDKVIIIYDLRTATKWRLLEGHSGSIAALAFDPDGSYLASYSIEELCVKTWQAGSSGFLGGILGLNAKCTGTIKLPKVETEVNPRDKVLKCRIRWMSPKQVRLRREDGNVISFDL
eukprot:g1878.t1